MMTSCFTKIVCALLLLRYIPTPCWSLWLCKARGRQEQLFILRVRLPYATRSLAMVIDKVVKVFAGTV